MFDRCRWGHDTKEGTQTCLIVADGDMTQNDVS